MTDQARVLPHDHVPYDVLVMLEGAISNATRQGQVHHAALPRTATMIGWIGLSLVKQRGSRDCGVATVANYCDVTYEAAMRAGASPIGSQFSDIQKAIKKLTGKRLVPRYARTWEDVPEDAIVSVRYKGEAKYHWVMKRFGDIVVDPAHGYYMPNRINFRTCHFMVPEGHPALDRQ